jgi:hypothetical protein
MNEKCLLAQAFNTAGIEWVVCDKIALVQISRQNKWQRNSPFTDGFNLGFELKILAE